MHVIVLEGTIHWLSVLYSRCKSAILHTFGRSKPWNAWGVRSWIQKQIYHCWKHYHYQWVAIKGFFLRLSFFSLQSCLQRDANSHARLELYKRETFINNWLVFKMYVLERDIWMKIHFSPSFFLSFFFVKALYIYVNLRWRKENVHLFYVKLIKGRIHSFSKRT